MKTPEKPGRCPRTGQFIKGYKGGGRRKGSRNLLTEQFFDCLYADFLKNGSEAIEKCREQQPGVYVNAIVKLMPREIKAELDASEAFVKLWEAIADNRLEDFVATEQGQSTDLRRARPKGRA